MKNREKTIQCVTQNIRIIIRAVQAHSKLVEKACGLSSAQLGMLNEVAMSPGLKVSQLATILMIHPSTCSNMLDKLEAKELIVRDRQKTDQRSVFLYVTDSGKELLSSAPKPLQGKLSGALSQLTDEQLETLNLSLENLTESLEIDDNKVGVVPYAP